MVSKQIVVPSFAAPPGVLAAAHTYFTRKGLFLIRERDEAEAP